jgi:hypothetical protein
MSVPTAYAVELAQCGDPECKALHIISLDENGRAIMNTSLSPNFMVHAIKLMQDHL